MNGELEIQVTAIETGLSIEVNAEESEMEVEFLEVIS